MTFKEWRERNNCSLERCAELFGAANGSVISRYERGIRIPNREHMRRIYVQTRGAVDPNSFYDLPDLAALPREDAA
jgi:transcriptional regulator with XRE-family HTH domain